MLSFKRFLMNGRCQHPSPQVELQTVEPADRGDPVRFSSTGTTVSFSATDDTQLNLIDGNSVRSLVALHAPGQTTCGISNPPVGSDRQALSRGQSRGQSGHIRGTERGTETKHIRLTDGPHRDGQRRTETDRDGERRLQPGRSPSDRGHGKVTDTQTDTDRQWTGTDPASRTAQFPSDRPSHGKETDRHADKLRQAVDRDRPASRSAPHLRGVTLRRQTDTDGHRQTHPQTPVSSPHCRR